MECREISDFKVNYDKSLIFLTGFEKITLQNSVDSRWCPPAVGTAAVFTMFLWSPNRCLGGLADKWVTCSKFVNTSQGCFKQLLYA